ncbi:MAG: TonB-dependent receptor [Solimonas sp.]
MRRRNVSSLVLVAALAASFPALPAWSAETPDDAGSAAIAPAAGDDTQIADVIVTARRRDERAQDVPTALSSASGSELERNGVSQVQELQQLLPNLNAAYIHARQSALAVRGIGNNPANEGLEGSVGLYLDNVYLGRPGMAVFDLLDLAQVDLLRGPQGTLFGKNTTAGVLNIATLQPTFTPEGSVSASAGSRDYLQARGTVSGPLTDTLAGRLSLAKTHDDGWLRNLSDGRRLDSVDREGGRGQLLYKPDDGFSLRLIGDYNNEDDSQGTSVVTGIGPAKSGYRNLDDAATATGASAVPSDWRKYEVTLDGPQRMVARQGGTSAEANVKLGDYTLTSITAWRTWKFSPHNDVDMTDADIISDYGFKVRDDQVSQEIRLASPTGSAFDYVLGAYYFRQNVRNTLTTVTGDEADVAELPTPYSDLGLHVLDNITSINHGKVVTDSYALFAQGNWHVTQRFDVTAGVRGTYEEKAARVYRDEPIGATEQSIPAFQTVQDGQVGAWDSGRLTQHELSPSGLLTFSYRPLDGLLGYLTLSHGEKSGGFNVNGVGVGPSAGADALRVGPERANDVELGLKSTLWNHRLLLNGNLFLTRVGGYQAAAVVTPQDSSTPVQTLTNVDEVESRGIEWDIRALPLRGLTLVFNGAYTDAHYRSFDNAPCPAETNDDSTVPTSCDLSGKQVQGAPRWTVNSIAAYEWRWSERLRQSVSASYAWRSSANGSIDNSIYNELPAYGLFNASTGLQFDIGGSRQLAFSVWGRNLADQRYLLSGGSTINNAYTGSVGAPRTVGATLGYSF